MARPVPWGLRTLLTRLQAYRVDWRFSFVPTENEEYEVGTDREVEEDLDNANVISSARKDWFDFVADTEAGPLPVLKRGEDGRPIRVPRHAVLLDIDYPAHLIESSTAGHYHLYLDVPNGVPHEKYMALLKLLGECGVIEKGFADVSVARGHSDLRLPWVSKDDQVLHKDGVDSVAAQSTTPLDVVGTSDDGIF